MTPAAKVRARQMLAGLRSDRFSLLKEADLQGLGIPYDLRRLSADEMLLEKAARPVNKMIAPPMSSEAHLYWSTRDSWCRESRSMYNRAVHMRPALEAAWAKHERHLADRLQPPGYGEFEGARRKIQFWLDQISSMTDTCARLWAAVPDIDKLRFYDPMPLLQWPCHYPTFAVTVDPIDHTYGWWPEGIPEYRRQIRLLEWAVNEA